MTKARIVADYEAGSDASEIAARNGTTAWTVRHRLRRAGVPLRSSSMTDTQVQHVRSLRDEGLSYDRIAQQVGFSATTIRNVLKRLES